MLNKWIVFLLFIISVVICAYLFTPGAALFKFGVLTERKIAGLVTKSVMLSEGEVSYLEGGEGKTLLLLHGFGANKDNWNRLARHLTSDYHVIALDLPGFGDSFKNIQLDYDLNSQVTRLNEFVNKLELNPLHIAGNSMGGYIAGNYAAAFPDKVISLWLLNPLGVGQAPASEMFTMLSDNKRPVVLAQTRAQYQQLLSYVFYQPPYIPEVFITELANQAQANFPLHAKIFADNHQSIAGRITFASPLDQVLKQFAKPVLITWGDQDRILHPEGAYYLEAILPNGKVVMMEDIGHLPMLEAPAATAQQFMLFQKGRS